MEWARGLEGFTDPAHQAHKADPDRRGRNQLLHASVRQRRGGLLHAGGVQGRRNPPAKGTRRGYNHHGGGQDFLCIGLGSVLGPIWKEATIAIGHSWDGPLLNWAGPRVKISRSFGPQASVGHSTVRGGHVRRCLVLFDWARAHHVGVLVGDFSDAVARPGIEPGGVGEPAGERGGGNDFSYYFQENFVWGSVFCAWGNYGGGYNFLLLLVARNKREEFGGNWDTL